MEEKIIIKVSVMDHFQAIKNMNIKSFLNLMSSLSIPGKDKKTLRDSFLDSINSYDREVKRAFNSLFGEE